MANGKQRLSLLRDPAHLLATGFGVGLIPWAPGTAGTALAVPFYLLISGLDVIAYGVITVAALVVGIPACGRTTRALGQHDHPAIVWDEFVGFLVTMFAAPTTWQTVLLGFILFRIFDILKPWPIATLDRHVHGGMGVMIDDFLAGIYAAACLQLLIRASSLMA